MPDEKISLEKLPPDRAELKAAKPTGKISDAFGFLKKKTTKRLSIEEIGRIAARGWSGKR